MRNSQPLRTNLVRATLFPASLALATVAAWLAITVAALAAVVGAERWLPRVGRPAEPGELRADLGFVTLSSAVASWRGRR